MGGGVLCLGSALLGNTLNTVGFEFNSAKTDVEKRRIQNLSIVMIFINVCLASLFFVLNRSHPTLFFQAALIASSGSALSDILPINPMSGVKIWERSKVLWGSLFVLVITMFMLFNFVL